MQHQMRFDSANLFLRSCSWALMNCYDYSISQNIHMFCYYNYKAHVSQTVSHPSFRLTQTCVQPHTRTHTHKYTIKQGLRRGQVCLFTVVLPLCVWMCVGCVALSLHCVVGDKQLTSVTLLLTWAQLHWERGWVNERGAGGRSRKVQKERRSKKERRVRKISVCV